MKIKEGDQALLFLDSKRNYLIKVKRGERLHTHKGFILHDDIIGKEYGDFVKSNLGIKFLIFKPTIKEFVMKMKRATQIMYPKDLSIVTFYSGIGPGSRIVEAGTGTGALASTLAHFIRPDGKVYSYEIREEYIKIAERNLRKAGLFEYIEIKHKDITKGIDEKEVDAVILDLATPWLVVPHAYKALKSGGIFVSFSPTIEQVVKAVEALEREGFVHLETIECFIRRIKVKRGESRPETRMIGHTGYITFARKIRRGIN